MAPRFQRSHTHFMATLILFNKPFNVLSQFTDAEGRATLADYISHKNIYPAGRLDYDSEGLLLLTDDGRLQHQISHPDQKLPKTYWAQVEGSATPEQIAPLQQGIVLNDGPCRPAKVSIIAPPKIWDRNPPIRQRESIPTSWLKLTISEGRNRQVRRMTSAIGLPTLRLIRVQIGNWSLDGLEPGQFRTETVHTAAKKTRPASRPPRRC